jgi:CBS domain-containing protein
MSPRAACRLEALGFTELYDYVAGKADWLARALPTEGDEPRPRRAADLLRRDVATADMHERLAAVLPRVHASPYGFALVTGRGGVLLGRLRRAALEGDPAATAEQVMEAGPSTIRPDTEATALARRLRERELTTAVVTDPDGVLLGVVRLVDLEQERTGGPQS